MMKFYRYRRPLGQVYIIGADIETDEFIDSYGLGKMKDLESQIRKENSEQIELEDMTVEEMLTQTNEFWRAVMEYPR